MMKKEARLKAGNMFLEAGGKITNKEIAEVLHVNALTVGRWRREDDWATILSARDNVAPGDGKPPLVRKRSARDLAEKLYLEEGGNVSNKELAAAVGVSPATISKWKDVDRWIEKIEFEGTSRKTVQESHGDVTVELSEMIAPGQIIDLNRRIDMLLAREHLAADEIVDLAAAKNSLLEAVVRYLSISNELKTTKPPR
jgi:uncharacterized protein YjcR